MRSDTERRYAALRESVKFYEAVDKIKIADAFGDEELFAEKRATLDYHMSAIYERARAFAAAYERHELKEGQHAGDKV